MFRPTIVRLFAASVIALSMCQISLLHADDKPAASAMAMPEMKLPKGWTSDDMNACMAAATPGKSHEFLTKSAGTWTGKSSNWMAPDTEPTISQCKAVMTPIMDGKFVKCDWSGDMPGMGAFNGMGLYGFDNVSSQYQCTWIDSMGTGMLNGSGAVSADGKTMTWTMHFNCPITKKASIMREVETITSDTTRTLEMFAPDPKTGKEFKMMSIELTRQP